MTLRTFTQFRIVNARNGETDPRRWLSSQAAYEAAQARTRNGDHYATGDWRVWSELVVVQPEPDKV